MKFALKVCSFLEVAKVNSGTFNLGCGVVGRAMLRIILS